MLYQITRGGQTYGPYTLADLQRYVASGHVLLTDLAKSDEMAEWATVSQILNPTGLPPANPIPPIQSPTAPFSGTYAQPVPAVPMVSYPDPPNLGWGLVLLFDILTCGLFQIVWNFVMSAWMKRVQRNSQALTYYAVGYVISFVVSGITIPPIIASFQNHTHPSSHFGLSMVSLAALIIRIFGHFNMKSSLEEHFNTVEPMGFQMSGVLLFLFGGIYIQSQLNRINEIKQAIRYRDFGR